jgi:hypothetical protein
VRQAMRDEVRSLHDCEYTIYGFPRQSGAF